MDLNNSIRYLALKYDNKRFLHSDPILKNFLYQKTTNKVYAIDSEYILKNKSVYDLDSLLLSLTLRSILLLDVPEEQTKEYVSLFKDAIGKAKSSALVSYEYDPPFSRVYMTIREQVAHRLKSRPYIDQLAEQNTFLKKYNSFARDILETA